MNTVPQVTNELKDTNGQNQPKWAKDMKHIRPKDGKPYKYQPLVQMTSHPNPGVYNEFTLSISGAIEFCRALAGFVVQAGDRFRSGMIEPPVANDNVIRMFFINLAKKLATSADPITLAVQGRELGPLRKLEPFCPTPMRLIIDGYGSFSYNGAQFRPTEVSLYAFNAFAHAVYRPGLYTDFNGVLDPEVFVVNTRHTGWKQQLLNMVRNHYNQWADNSGIQVPLPNGLVIQLPRVVTGFQQLNLLLAGLAIPLDVTNAIQVGIALEQGMNQADFPNAEQTIALRAFGIFVFTWGPEQIQDLIERYYRESEQLISDLLNHVFGGERVSKYADTGAPWQLMNYGTNSMATHPFDLPMSSLEVGLVVRNRTSYRVSNQLVQTASSEGSNTARDKFIRHHIRKEGHLV